MNFGDVEKLDRTGEIDLVILIPGARPTKHISIEFEIRWKFKTL